MRTSAKNNAPHLQPKVSVIIPTRNRVHYLRQAVQSVLDQSYAPFEIIICDNASADETTDFLRTLKDERIHWVRHTRDMGVIPNLNFGVRMSRGSLITILPDDDLMLPGNLQKKAEVLARNTELGFVFSKVNQINQKNEPFIFYKYWQEWAPSENKQWSSTVAFENLIEGNNFIPLPSIVFRKSCFMKFGPFNPQNRYACDWELWLKITTEFGCAYLAEALVAYRWHGENGTFDFGRRVGNWHCYQAKRNAIKLLGKSKSKKQLRRRVELSYFGNVFTGGLVALALSALYYMDVLRRKLRTHGATSGGNF